MHPLADLSICLRFFSRLPVPTTRREIELGAGGLAAAAWMAPLAGACIGGLSAIVLLAATATGLTAGIAAPLAIAASLVLTGALHEDGLADCADGFGGGRTRERKLAIMRDSRIGTYGACAIALSLYLRAAALGVVATRSPWLGAAVLVAGAALSRAACLVPLVLLPPAREEGMGADTRPDTRALILAIMLAVVIAACLLGRPVGFVTIGAALSIVTLIVLCVCGLAMRHIGGQTGDVAGAVLQLAEVAVYVVCGAA